MFTQYWLPFAHDSADTARAARRARTLAGMVLVIVVFGLLALIALTPDAAAPVVAAPDDDSVQAQPIVPLGA